MDQQRRSFLRSGLIAAAVPAVAATSSCDGGHRRRAALLDADANGVRLPAGFSSRVVARSGTEVVPGSGFYWHAAPDGGVCMPYVSISGGGWVYVSNAEVSFMGGGASAIKFDNTGDVIDAYSILQFTSRNCAGGLTPWDTWLSCEETELGQVWECDPLGVQVASLQPALGSFNHEAVAVDPVGKRLYLTEDKPDGGLYRFTPDSWTDLSSGLLEIAVEVAATSFGRTLGWQQVPDPDATGTPTRYQNVAVATFDGGEGIVYAGGKLFFTTKGDNSVWKLDIDSSVVVRLYDDDDYPVPELTGVDNITVDASGNLYVAEDGGNMQVVMVTLGGSIVPIAQIDGHDKSEITGVAFSPDGTRLYFSSQRGETGRSEDGVTYEVSGPFAELSAAL